MMTDQARVDVLLAAARTAGQAPSVHNTQPWRWRVHPDHLDLYADRDRQLRVADPDGRLLLLSCGAALNHAELTLAALGWQAEVERPVDDRTDHLARVRLGRQAEPSDTVTRRYQAIGQRRTDRRPLSDQSVPPQALTAVRTTVEDRGAHLHLLREGQVNDLAVAAAQADRQLQVDPRWQEELTLWTGEERPAGAGLPDEVIPGAQPATHVPVRDFGRSGTLPVADDDDRAAVYAVIFGDRDAPDGWLRGGEALSAAWLAATDHGLALLPFSSVVESAPTRAVLHRLLSGLGYPYLVLRIGRPVPDLPPPAPTERLEPEQTIEIVGGVP